MEAARISQTPANFYQTKRRYNPVDRAVSLFKDAILE